MSTYWGKLEDAEKPSSGSTYWWASFAFWGWLLLMISFAISSSSYFVNWGPLTNSTTSPAWVGVNGTTMNDFGKASLFFYVCAGFMTTVLFVTQVLTFDGVTSGSWFHGYYSAFKIFQLSVLALDLSFGILAGASIWRTVNGLDISTNSGLIAGSIFFCLSIACTVASIGMYSGSNENSEIVPATAMLQVFQVVFLGVAMGVTNQAYFWVGVNNPGSPTGQIANAWTSMLIIGSIIAAMPPLRYMVNFFRSDT